MSEKVNSIDAMIIAMSRIKPETPVKEAIVVCSFNNLDDPCGETVVYRSMTLTIEDKEVLGIFSFCKVHDPKSATSINDALENQ